MLVLSNDEIQSLLSMEACLECLEKAYRDLARGRAVNRPRTDLYLPTATDQGVYCFKSMEGGLAEERVVALRLNSDVIRWKERGGRTVKEKIPAAAEKKWVGLILLFSAETGEPMAIFPDGVIQGLRVAASSALAARYLAREDSGTLGLLGAGWQARAHVLAMCAVRKIRKIRLYSPTPANRELFAKEMEEKAGVPIEPVDAPEKVARDADILVAATNSVSRVISPEWIEPGLHFTCVKAVELGEDTIGKAQRIVIHARKHAPENYIAGYGDEKIEAHDPIDFLREPGSVARKPEKPFWLDAPELKDLIGGKVPGRESSAEATCFVNNIGLGLQFAALGAHVYAEARSRGLGREIPTDWFLETVHP